MARFLCFAFTALAILSFAAPDLQAQYNIDQSLNGGYNPWIKGQSFTPSIGIVPNPGTVPTLDLTQITFYRSFQAWVGPSSRFYLNIYDGDPVNGSGVFVGSSSNSVDVASLGDMAPMVWMFDKLTLNYTHEYWALVSSTNTSGGFDVYCGMRESGQTDPYTGGTSIAGITTDPAGYHTKSTIDLAFEIDLTDSISSLKATAYTLSESTGGIIDFTLDAGAAHANRTYIILGSITGTTPGLPMPGGMVILPLVWDQFTEVTLAYGNSLAMLNFRSSLDASGLSTAQLNSLGPLPPGMLGVTMYYAYTLYSPPWNHCDYVSNPIGILVVP